MSALNDALGKLHAAAEELNAQSEEVNRIIDVVNERLAKSRVGMTVWGFQNGYPILLSECEAPRRARMGLQLGYTKTRDQWQLAVRMVTAELVRDEADEDWSWVISPVEEAPSPLKDAPRVARVEACRHLLTLVEQLTARAEQFSKGIAEGRAQLGLRRESK